MRWLAILLFLPVFCFGQYRADRNRANPNVHGKDAAGYGFRGHWGTESSSPVTPPFDPDFDGNLWGWYDFTDTAMVIQNSSNLVSTWRDKSVNNNDLTATNKPTYTSNGIVFTAASSTYMTKQATLDEPITIYAQVKIRSWIINNLMFDGYDTDVMGVIMNPTTPNISMWGATAAGCTNDGMTVGEFSTLTIIWNGANSSIQVDDGSPVTCNPGKASAKGGFTVGSFGGGILPSNIDVRKIVIREGADSDSIQDLVRTMIETPTPTNVDVWILAGQSNAVGYDTVKNITIPGYDDTLTHGYIWSPVADSCYAHYIPGVNSLWERTGCFGVENSFLKDLSAYKNANIFLLKYAVGGTLLHDDTTANTWNSGRDDALFNTLLKRISEQNAWLVFNGFKPRIKGIIWIQGEYDAILSYRAVEYYDNLIAMMDSLQLVANIYNAANGRGAPTLLKVIPKIRCSRWAQGATVCEAEDDFATARAKTFIFETDPYATVDGAHYDADALIQIGTKIFNAIKDE